MADSPRGETSTIPPEISGTNGWERVVRVVTMTLIVGVVVAGSLGLLGVRAGVATATGEGLTLTVTHASVTRAGLATPFGMTITSTDGGPLPPTVTTRFGSSYLTMFDENGLEPEPTSTFQDGEWTWWTFDVADGAAELVITFDARLEPAVQWGQSSTAAIEVDGVEAASVDFATWVLP